MDEYCREEVKAMTVDLIGFIQEKSLELSKTDLSTADVQVITMMSVCQLLSGLIVSIAPDEDLCQQGLGIAVSHIKSNIKTMRG